MSPIELINHNCQVVQHTIQRMLVCCCQNPLVTKVWKFWFEHRSIYSYKWGWFKLYTGHCNSITHITLYLALDLVQLAPHIVGFNVKIGSGSMFARGTTIDKATRDLCDHHIVSIFCTPTASMLPDVLWETQDCGVFKPWVAGCLLNMGLKGWCVLTTGMVESSHDAWWCGVMLAHA